MAKRLSGIVASVEGGVVGVEFRKALPPILAKLYCTLGDGREAVLEVQDHIDAAHARCLAIDPTQGMARGDPVAYRGETLSVPVGKGVLGRMMNVKGEPIDGKGPFKDTK
ncbi:MAG: F0F1 ATP synthase subunit beta, partial [Rickettsiales bacterium]|nr:F0F1 ATP synthase subunit beta [Rickettsiales bacterium]